MSKPAADRFNLASYFLDRDVEEDRGERVALVCDREGAGAQELTYAELSRLANRVGNVLRELGVRAEERVLLALSDGPEFVASWFAVVKVGAVVAEVYTFLQASDYAYYLDYTRARVVVCDGSTLERLREARVESPWLRTLLVVGAEGPLLAGEESFEELVGRARAELEAAPTSRDDIALWKFTTGSTGAPKAAVHAMGDPLVSFERYALGVLDLREDDAVLPVPKLFFGYGRDLAALFPFGVGARGVVFPERSTPERLFELIERHRPTVLVNVPTMMSAMVGHPDAARADLSSLRVVVSSGEALPEGLHRQWLDTFRVEVVEGIGSSELYHIYVSNRPGTVRAGSAGLVVPGYRARLLDGEGGEVPDGEPGELWVAGGSKALLYWGDRVKSERTFVGEWVRTGDLFARDADGFFSYRGRADDLLKVGGIWVAPIEIENALGAHPAVAECAVVGHEKGGLVLPRAYVVPARAPERDERALEAELISFVRARLAPHKTPREVVFLSELPKTANGKVDRRALREDAEAPAGAATGTGPA